MVGPSVRADIITRGRYCRPLGDGTFETWSEVIDRVIKHQEFLWERVGTPDLKELEALRECMLTRRALLAGRTLWLGGTETARKREASQFNCSFLKVETVHDLVDAFWLLLQGCGVGFKASPGQLSGFPSRIPNLEIVRSKRTSTEGSGFESNGEVWNPQTKTWRIAVGDSAEAWAKSMGKLTAGKFPGCHKLIIDLSAIRGKGGRLAGYGWICSGDEMLARAFEQIFKILNGRIDALLTHEDIHDILNLMGTVLSSRRSAELSEMEWGRPGWEKFALYKRDYWSPEVNKPWREQSNNSLLFETRPSPDDLHDIFKMILEGGGSEPGFLNAVEARRRAPWFSGVNPCAEILLANKGFCNLCEVDVAHPANKTVGGMSRTMWLMARANYRQTCVNLEDGVLQRAWHENNQFFRLCGVSLCGLVRSNLSNKALQFLRTEAHHGAQSMAEELGLPVAKNVTCIKPGGTLPKIMDTTEGMTRPDGMYIFNNVQFADTDVMLGPLADANYEIKPHPTQAGSVLVKLPIAYSDVPFHEVEGKAVNIEKAIHQLDRYKDLMENYCDQNVSCTIRYDPEEVPEIVEWLDENWDSYVGVSWLLRNDPTKTAKDLGYAYLPQEVVDPDTFFQYEGRLDTPNFDDLGTLDGLQESECEGGSCPAR